VASAAGTPLSVRMHVLGNELALNPMR
jgi:hypothetical protein